MLPCRPSLLASSPSCDALADHNFRLAIRKLRYVAAALKAAGKDTVAIELQTDHE